MAECLITAMTIEAPVVQYVVRSSSRFRRHTGAIKSVNQRRFIFHKTQTYRCQKARKNRRFSFIASLNYPLSHYELFGSKISG